MEARLWAWNFRLLWCSHFFSVASLTVLAPFMPFYMQEIGAVDEQAVLLWSGMALAAPAVSYALTGPLWGKLGDRFGRKFMVVRALFGLALTLFLMGIADSPLEFLIYRILQGAFGGVVDAGTAFAGSQAPADQKGKVFGKLDSALAAGALSGPLVGGFLVGHWGFQPLLFGLAVLVALWALAAVVLLREERSSVAQERRRSAGVLETIGELFTVRRLRLFLLAGICATMGSYGLVTVFGPQVQGAVPAGQATVYVGLLQATSWAAGFFGSMWWGKRNDRQPVARNFTWAALICGVSVFGQGLPVPVEWMFPLRVLQGFAYSALLQSVYLEVSRQSTEDNRGVRVGSTGSVLVTGQIAGPLITAGLAVWFSAEYVFAALGLLFVTGAFFTSIADVGKHEGKRTVKPIRL